VPCFYYYDYESETSFSFVDDGVDVGVVCNVSTPATSVAVSELDFDLIHEK
jgi:hypothetical protein